MATLLAAGASQADDLNRIVLRVNDQVFTLQDYQARKTERISAVLAAPNLPQEQQQEALSKAGQMVMQEMFRELLLDSRAHQLRIRIEEGELQEAVSNMIRSNGFESEEQLQQALDASGMTIEKLNENIRRELLFNRVVGRDVTALIEVGDEELRAYYRNNAEQFTIPEKRWLKEVIVLESSGAEADELARMAAEIRGKLQEGGEFETVIESYRSSNLTTGVIDLDWLQEHELDATLAEVAFALEPGAYSEPISSRGGLHIIHLAGLQESKIKPFKEVADQILNIERGRRFNKELADYMSRLERQAYIMEDIPAEAVGYRSLAGDLADGLGDEDEIDIFRQPVLPAPEEAEGSDTVEGGTAEGGTAEGGR
jgi:parvulin-like peptidyl-prolyl isomerase